MVYTKVQIYNLALGALLLTRRVIDLDLDTSTEVKVLNTHWDVAFSSVLEDLDLDATSSPKALELIMDNPTPQWQYSYKYPNDCAFLRKIQSAVLKDTRSTQISKRVATLAGQKVILTNEFSAVAEYISTDVPLSSLSANAGLAVAYQLALMSTSLVVGKGASKVEEAIQKKYALARMNAQEHDRLENADFDDPATISEFVEARIS